MKWQLICKSLLLRGYKCGAWAAGAGVSAHFCPAPARAAGLPADPGVSMWQYPRGR